MDAKDLKQIRKKNGISQKELASYLGVGQSFVSQIERGASPIPETIVEKIESNPEWNVRVETIENHGNLTVQEIQENGYKMLPLIPREAIAHPKDKSFSKENVEDYYNVREFKDCDFLIRAKGDAMSPKYSGGDLVACRIVSDTFLQWGRIYFIQTSQGGMIKRIQPSSDPDKIICRSENHRYGEFEIPKSEILMLAIVTGSITLE